MLIWIPTLLSTLKPLFRTLLYYQFILSSLSSQVLSVEENVFGIVALYLYCLIESRPLSFGQILHRLIEACFHPFFFTQSFCEMSSNHYVIEVLWHQVEIVTLISEISLSESRLCRCQNEKVLIEFGFGLKSALISHFKCCLLHLFLLSSCKN